MPVELPDGHARPLRRGGSSAVELDDNVALYDEVGQFLILLNTSAATVWELCDGATTVDQIVRALTELHPEQAAEIADDVRRTVGKLTELGLVVEAEAGADAGAEAGSA
jgi:coenzyme PQQ synthesis protein D (PqqD)